jgi:hypothetical protein
MIRTETNKKRVYLQLFFMLGLMFQLHAQQSKNRIEGSVSYISGQSIYVKFESTQGMENGDTLFLNKNEIAVPVLLVQHHSSISCLCKAIGDNSFKISDKIFVKVKSVRSELVTEIQAEEQIEKDVSEQVLISSEPEITKTKVSQNVNGQLRLSSYSNFSNTISDDSYRFRYTFSMKASNISDSKLSAETYISFSHKLNQWDVIQENLNNALKIYSLAVKYDFNETTSLWAGRKINPKIANIGAVDGLQFQKQWNNFSVGAVAGTRPDFQDYGYNPKLFEYGAYIGQSHKVENGFIQTSLAFFEQRNGLNIDRRFVYFQHNNSFLKNVNIFSSFELDLYKLENGEPQNTVNLISLYLSARYRISRRLSLFGSYDNRKNVIYYETFKNYANEVLQQASRQGFRVRINYRPINYLNFGINSGTRFRKDDTRTTKTLNGYTTYSRIPVLNASFTLSANLMQTSYLDGQIYGARLSKEMLNGKIYGMLNYRWIKFDYANSDSKLNQNIGGIDFSYRFNKKLYLSVNYEATFQDNENYNRIYLNLRKKF